MNTSVAQVRADLPRDLKRKAFAAFALRDIRFSTWLRTQIETWLEELELEEVEGQRTSQQESRRYETVSERVTRA